MPASRITATIASTIAFGSTVSAGCSGSILVSMLKRTLRLPLFSTSAKRSVSRGMRSPSTGCCSGNRAAYSLPGRSLPTSYAWSCSYVSVTSGAPAPSRNFPSAPRVMSGFSIESWLTTTTPSRVTPQSSSSVATPSSSAWRNAASVFSGRSPRAPRWPCRSNTMGSSAFATVVRLGPQPQARASTQAARLRFIMPASSRRGAATARR